MGQMFIDQFDREVTCTYHKETYIVRDNGSILRYCRSGTRKRPLDEKWTFGKLNRRTGYVGIASVRVHRIVATAFRGEPPTKQNVVDHIDTNKQNNRPENLRWLTRFENVVLNPITAKRIAIVCGSVEAFLDDPSKYRDKFQEPNLQWMCNVSKQDAQVSLERMLAWAKSDKQPSGGSLGDWIYNRPVMQNQDVNKTREVPDLIMALTLNASQRNWTIPSEFPLCPHKNTKEPLSSYAKNLKAGLLFCRNDVYSSLVLKSSMSDDHQSIYVICESTEGKDAIKQWALAKITFENGLYVHTSLHSFFTLEGAEKQYVLAQGLEWTGGDSIDDYC